MKNTKLFRKRIIPPECIPLVDDEILYRDEDLIVTKWKTLKPKKDLDHGISAYFLKEGYKVSKFMCSDGSLLYWYCDIIEYSYSSDTDTYIFTDLLADVVICPDGSLRVIDIDEIADSLESDTLSKEQSIRLLRSLDSLLKKIYSGEFSSLKAIVDKYSDQ
ncbi:MAG: DUF402 domain-containing protein [Lachnospiraceae bacterium]|nr:DUF402 domain-containing protein [Lachnospiraceae bacterium]